MMWHTLESLSLVSVNERETIWANFSVYHALGLWTIHPQFHLRTNSFIYTEYWVSRKDTVWKNKSLLLKILVNYYSMTCSPDPGYLWVLDAKALSHPGTECLTILLAGKVKCISEACDLWMNMPEKTLVWSIWLHIGDFIREGKTVKDNQKWIKPVWSVHSKGEELRNHSAELCCRKILTEIICHKQFLPRSPTFHHCWI